MLQLNPNECRVLGVLVEKATTTPEQYPLSLNATVNGANQKNNRDPVLALTEDEVFDALEGLREKGLVVRVDTPGSRVHKYRHNATDALHVRAGELAILAELLMRGPQTIGELRGRASRMTPMETLEIARQMLDALMNRSEPLVKEIPSAPGSRAERFVQLLCADLHPLNVSPAQAIAAISPTSAAANSPAESALAERLARLEQKVEKLTQSLTRLAEKLGETDLSQ